MPDQELSLFHQKATQAKFEVLPTERRKHDGRWVHEIQIRSSRMLAPFLDLDSLGTKRYLQRKLKPNLT